jgi:hypothetical protein
MMKAKARIAISAVRSDEKYRLPDWMILLRKKLEEKESWARARAGEHAIRVMCKWAITGTADKSDDEYVAAKQFLEQAITAKEIHDKYIGDVFYELRGADKKRNRK